MADPTQELELALEVVSSSSVVEFEGPACLLIDWYINLWAGGTIIIRKDHSNFFLFRFQWQHPSGSTKCWLVSYDEHNEDENYLLSDNSIEEFDQSRKIRRREAVSGGKIPRPAKKQWWWQQSGIRIMRVSDMVLIASFYLEMSYMKSRAEKSAMSWGWFYSLVGLRVVWREVRVNIGSSGLTAFNSDPRLPPNIQ